MRLVAKEKSGGFFPVSFVSFLVGKKFMRDDPAPRPLSPGSAHGV